MGESFGKGLDQSEAGRFNDGPGDLEHRSVVDRSAEVVLDARRLEIEDHLNINMERLVAGLLGGGHSMTALEDHVVKDDSIAHRAIMACSTGIPGLLSAG